MKLKLLFAALFVSLLLCGCGHNAIQFSKGIGFDAGFDPEHMSARLNLRYGEILSVAARDNLEVELATGMEGGTAEAPNASTKTDSSLKIRIGQQINGYFVEAVEAGADAKDLVNMNKEDSEKYLEAEIEKAWKTARERGPKSAEKEESAAQTAEP